MLDIKHFAGLILNDQLGLSLSSLKSQDVTRTERLGNLSKATHPVRDMDGI